VQATPNAMVYANRGNALLKMKKPLAAIRDADEALKINPDSAKVCVYVCVCERERERERGRETERERERERELMNINGERCRCRAYPHAPCQTAPAIAPKLLVDSLSRPRPKQTPRFVTCM
jgi:hypothetical protein